MKVAGWLAGWPAGWCRTSKSEVELLCSVKSYIRRRISWFCFSFSIGDWGTKTQTSTCKENEEWIKDKRRDDSLKNVEAFSHVVSIIYFFLLLRHQKLNTVDKTTRAQRLIQVVFFLFSLSSPTISHHQH